MKLRALRGKASRKQLPSALAWISRPRSPWRNLPAFLEVLRPKPRQPNLLQCFPGSYDRPALNARLPAAQLFDVSSFAPTRSYEVTAEDEVHICAVRCSAGSSQILGLSHRTVEVQAPKADGLHRPESAVLGGRID
jgi:hypothetical protein